MAAACLSCDDGDDGVFFFFCSLLEKIK